MKSTTKSMVVKSRILMLRNCPWPVTSQALTGKKPFHSQKINNLRPSALLTDLGVWNAVEIPSGSGRIRSIFNPSKYFSTIPITEIYRQEEREKLSATVAVAGVRWFLLFSIVPLQLKPGSSTTRDKAKINLIGVVVINFAYHRKESHAGVTPWAISAMSQLLWTEPVTPQVDSIGSSKTHKLRPFAAKRGLKSRCSLIQTEQPTSNSETNWKLPAGKWK